MIKSNHYVRYFFRRIKSDLIALLDDSRALMMICKGTNDNRIVNWRHFSKQVRKKEFPLLLRLNEFPKSILVAGCQRSGTTMLSRVITQSDSMVKFSTGKDDELDAALILSGMSSYNEKGRHCFQTTYLNEKYSEYENAINGPHGHRLLWVIRNPYSVVYSMMYNWDDFALNELFDSCGSQSDSVKTGKAGRKVSRLEKACFSYNAKAAQLSFLKTKLDNQKLMVVDYEKLVQNKKEILPKIYKFIDLPYKSRYADQISMGNLNKYKTLSENEQEMVKKVSMPYYQEMLSLIDM